MARVFWFCCKRCCFYYFIFPDSFFIFRSFVRSIYSLCSDFNYFRPCHFAGFESSNCSFLMYSHHSIIFHLKFRYPLYYQLTYKRIYRRFMTFISILLLNATTFSDCRSSEDLSPVFGDRPTFYDRVARVNDTTDQYARRPNNYHSTSGDTRGRTRDRFRNGLYPATIERY